MSMGASPAATSGAVHLAEMFTTAFSGLAHHRLGNVDKVLFFKLAIPGVISGLLGVWVLTSMDGQLIQPWVSAYLLVMGVFVIRKSLLAQQHKPTHQLRHVRQLALMGGFLDAIGGGGWGPIVTSGILGQGHDPRKTIGTVNAAEFLVTLATGLGFVVLGAIEHGVLVAGLVVGGLIAAPLAAFLTSRLPTRLLMGLVGLLISALSAYTLLRWINPF